MLSPSTRASEEAGYNPVCKTSQLAVRACVLLSGCLCIPCIPALLIGSCFAQPNLNASYLVFFFHCIMFRGLLSSKIKGCVGCTLRRATNHAAWVIPFHQVDTERMFDINRHFAELNLLLSRCMRKSVALLLGGVKDAELNKRLV